MANSTSTTRPTVTHPFNNSYHQPMDPRWWVAACTLFLHAPCVHLAPSTTLCTHLLHAPMCILVWVLGARAVHTLFVDIFLPIGCAREQLHPKWSWPERCCAVAHQRARPCPIGARVSWCGCRGCSAAALALLHVEHQLRSLHCGPLK